MKARHDNSGSDYLQEIDSKQRNIVWPGPLVNSRGVDEFFWKGSPNPTVIQRIAAWLFGLVFLGIAFVLSYIAWNLGGSAWVIFGGGAIVFLMFGVRHIWSGIFAGAASSLTEKETWLSYALWLQSEKPRCKIEGGRTCYCSYPFLCHGYRSGKTRRSFAHLAPVGHFSAELSAASAERRVASDIPATIGLTGSILILVPNIGRRAHHRHEAGRRVCTVAAGGVERT